ncbi:RNASEH1 [Mytilus edulis]|uniref:RnhA n=1 Tax=Mytilus edulis TaxID=6550 RepID=A0A8S3SR84_MYTED|nr:RNASEH1 [Mytilus edulis]
MVLQSEDMKRSTDIDSDYIESQFEFRGLAASKSPPEYWKNLGSSKTRSEEQAFQGKTIILEKIQQLKKNTTLAFTDGSCKGNPGPCGAGAAILISNSTEHVELTQPVSNRGSILLGELVAIKLTPGHADIQGNELADQLAKKAAQEAEKIQSIPIFTKQDIQKGAKDSVMLKWQNRWDTSEKGRRYYAFQQNVKNTIPKDKPSTEIYRITTSLRTGYCNLNSYKSMICPALIDKCSCGQIETVDHYLLDCENYEEAREKLRSALYFITSKLTLESEVLLATTENDNYKHHIEDIQDLLGVFIKDTGRFTK